MGGWLARYFQYLGVEVFLYDEIPEKAKASAEEIRVRHLDDLEKAVDSDLIVISIPITKTPGLIREIVSYIQKKGSRYVRLIDILVCQERNRIFWSF